MLQSFFEFWISSFRAHDAGPGAFNGRSPIPPEAPEALCLTMRMGPQVLHDCLHQQLMRCFHWVRPVKVALARRQFCIGSAPARFVM